MEFSQSENSTKQSVKSKLDKTDILVCPTDPRQLLLFSPVVLLRVEPCPFGDTCIVVEGERSSLADRKGNIACCVGHEGKSSCRNLKSASVEFIINQNWHLRIRNITLKYFCPSWASVHPAAFPLGGQDEILKCTILNSARSVWSLKEQDLNLAHNLIFNSPKSQVSKTVTCFFYTKPLISFKTRHFI